jgi:hypothetical protein
MRYRDIVAEQPVMGKQHPRRVGMTYPATGLFRNMRVLVAISRLTEEFADRHRHAEIRERESAGIMGGER